MIQVPSLFLPLCCLSAKFGKIISCLGEYNWIYSEKFPNQQPPEDSIDFRLGGSLKRRVCYDVAQAWHQANPDCPFRVSVIDAWKLTDNYAESTSDGRHWVVELKNALDKRTKQGQAEGQLILTLHLLTLIR